MGTRGDRQGEGRRRRFGAVRALVAAAALLGAAAPAGAATGIDVSRWQHPGGASIDWAQVRAAGHRFAFIKATDPVDGTNPWFAADWAGAAAAGLYRGAYHRARPGASSGADQASAFVAVVGASGGPADLPPVLDLEENGGLAPAALVTWARTWLETVQRLTGRAPILYTNYNGWDRDLGGTTALSGYRLWLARYTDAPAPDLLPSAWATWTFWQHSNTGSVPGVPATVDLDRYCCADANLDALTGTGSGDAAGNPFGVLDTAAGGPGAVRASGWAIDPDTTAPIAVHLYVDGSPTGVVADRSRPDVAAVFPGFGAGHGWEATVAGLAAGRHPVCAYGINTGSGTNALLGCTTATVPGGSPFGALDTATAGPQSATVQGWAIDPDTAAPIGVHVYVDGRPVAAREAARGRPDVGAAFPGYGPDHGYDVTVSGQTAGRHDVCVYAINTLTGTGNALLGCRAVTVPGGDPFGVLDEVAAAAGSVRARGWAIDPDTAAPITVHVYVDATPAAVAADGARPDVGAAFPGYGDSHGYDAVRTGVPPGSHQVCTYAINTLTGAANALLGCRSASVS